MRNRRRTRRNGFTISDFLLAIMIVSALLPIVTAGSAILPHHLQFDPSMQDEISLFQLRDILMLSYDINCSSDHLTYEYQGQDYELSLVNRKLIAKPGTQIFLTDLEEIGFFTKGNVVYASYTREGHQREAPLVAL